MPSLRHHRVVMRRHGVAIAAAGMFALTLSGCTGAPASTPTPSAPASADPVFASDEEALAAAVAAYEAYSAASAEVAMDGGINPERIDPTVTAEYGATLRDEFAALRDAELSLVGMTRIYSEKLAQFTQDEGGAKVSIYFCRDVSEVRVIGADGSDVTPSDRDERTPTQAFFVSSSQDAATILVDGVELWSGEDFC